MCLLQKTTLPNVLIVCVCLCMCVCVCACVCVYMRVIFFACCRDLLPSVHQEWFQSWVYTFGHEVIVYSSKHPVISGFYKLLSTCLIVCKKLEFFKVQDVWGGCIREHCQCLLVYRAVYMGACVIFIFNTGSVRTGHFLS